jgi:uncharacterized protein (TIGR00255 family)
MIKSMTAFARQEGQYAWGNLTCEIRSVNHRYLDLQFKLPDMFRQLEHKLRETLKKQLARGKVECAMKYTIDKGAIQSLAINETLVGQLVNASHSLEKQLSGIGPVNPLELLKWPGVLQETELDPELVEQQAETLFRKTLAEFDTNRGREGQELQQLISQRLDSVNDISKAVRGEMPAIIAGLRSKLEKRLGEIAADADPGRLEQELVYLVNKMDVDEELDRLETHITEVSRVLRTGGPCGRRLDFLMQELNREANTLSSKSVVSDTTQAAVELKVLIEQMREQIQNIE